MIRGVAQGSSVGASSLAARLHLSELAAHRGVLAVLTILWCVVAGMQLGGGAVLHHILFGEVLLVLAVFDFYYYYLYDCWVALLGVIALAAIVIGEQTAFSSITCALSAGGFMCIIRLFSRGGLGLGDVKLAAVSGLYLGYSDTVLALFLAFWLGGLVATGLIISRRATPRTRLPFGPFLVAGALIAMLYGAELWRLYEVLLC